MMVVIAEKPSLAGEIAKAIDPGARRLDGYYVAGGHFVTYAFGHLYEQLKLIRLTVRTRNFPWATA